MRQALFEMRLALRFAASGPAAIMHPLQQTIPETRGRYPGPTI